MLRNRFTHFGLFLVVIGLNAVSAMVGMTCVAYAAGEQVATLRAEVGKPLQAAQELIKAKKYKEALTKVREADAFGGNNAFETETIERMRGVAAYAAGDTLAAAKAFETVVESGGLAVADRIKLLQTLAIISYRARDYAKSAGWIERYVKEGGDDSKMRALLVQNYYSNGDYARAAKKVQAEIQAAEKEGNAPDEEQLQMLANCAAKQNDKVAYANVMEKLVAHYPKKEYWADLLARVRTKPGFSDRLSLDVLRLKLSIGQLTSTTDYMEMSQLSLQAGFPAEATKVIEQGYKSAALGGGIDAERHKRLRALAAKNAADDLKTMAQGEAEAVKSKDGTGLVNLGYAYVSTGQFDKGLAMMEQGLRRGGIRRINDAKLHIGVAYLQANKQAAAIQALKAVQGIDGTADLARYWIMLARRPAS